VPITIPPKGDPIEAAFASVELPQNRAAGLIQKILAEMGVDLVYTSTSGSTHSFYMQCTESLHVYASVEFVFYEKVVGVTVNEWSGDEGAQVILGPRVFWIPYTSDIMLHVFMEYVETLVFEVPDSDEPIDDDAPIDMPPPRRSRSKRNRRRPRPRFH
jgi:hypothetical protein